MSAQQPVQTELLMRYHQLQSRLATLKIENEEVRAVIVFDLYVNKVYPLCCAVDLISSDL